MGWPTTDDPKTEFITLRLTASEAADLDNYVNSTGHKSRSAAVRNAVSRVIAHETRRAKQAKHKRSMSPDDSGMVGEN